MEITKKAKLELDKKLKDIEDFIAEKGLGSSYVNRAKRVQRNVNIAIAVGSIITLTGIITWVLNDHEED